MIGDRTAALHRDPGDPESRVLRRRGRRSRSKSTRGHEARRERLTSDMKALILAAGVGQRLGQNRPKCLLDVGGRTLLERHLLFLRAMGVSGIYVAVGFRAEEVQAEIARIRAERWTRTVFNPDFRLGSLLSLWALQEQLRSGDDLVLMDADVLYTPAILERLMRSPIANCFLLDRSFEPGDEPVKLCVRDSRLVEFRKEIEGGLEYDYCGESVGFFRLSAPMAGRLAAAVEGYLARGCRDVPYEDAIRDLLLDDPAAFGFEDITGDPWIEIDFPEDLRRAREEVLPSIEEAP